MIDSALRRRLPWVEIDAPGGLVLNLDGEPVEARRFRAECLPGRLSLRAPGRSDVLAGATPAAA